VVGSEETIMLERNQPPAAQRDPWNKGRIIGQKRPLKPKDVWSILRAVQLLLGHTKLESTVRYLGIEVDDALAISEQVEL